MRRPVEPRCLADAFLSAEAGSALPLTHTQATAQRLSTQDGRLHRDAAPGASSRGEGATVFTLIVAANVRAVLDCAQRLIHHAAVDVNLNL